MGQPEGRKDEDESVDEIKSRQRRAHEEPRVNRRRATKAEESGRQETADWAAREKEAGRQAAMSKEEARGLAEEEEARRPAEEDEARRQEPVRQAVQQEAERGDSYVSDAYVQDRRSCWSDYDLESLYKAVEDYRERREKRAVATGDMKRKFEERLSDIAMPQHAVEAEIATVQAACARARDRLACPLLLPA